MDRSRFFPAPRVDMVMSIGWQIIMAVMVGLVAGVLTLAICGCSDTHTKTSDAIWKASTSNTAQAKTLGSLKGTVDGLTPTNVTAEKPKAQALAGTAIQQNKDVASALGGAAAGAKADAKTIQSLSDPVRVRLNWIGATLLVCGIAALVCGLIFATQLGSLATFLIEGGIASGVIGVGVLFVAQFLHTLYWICGSLLVLGVAGVAVWVVAHYWLSIVGLFVKAPVKSPTVG